MAWERTTRENLRKHIYHGSKSDFDMLELFLRANQFDKMHSLGAGTDIVRMLQTGQIRSYGDLRTVRPPYRDHVKFYKSSSTGICCMTYAPYVNAAEILPEVQQWAMENGVEADVYDSSCCWYYPGAACFVVIHLPGVRIRLK